MTLSSIFEKIGLLDPRRYFYRKRYILFERDLTLSSDKKAAPLISGITLKIVSNLSELERFLREGYDIRPLPIFSDVSDRLEEGGILFLVLVGMECAHASLVILERDTAVSLYPLYKKIDCANSGYVGPCYTHQKYRGKGLYTYVLSEICAFLKEKGMAKALIYTKKSNQASARGITKAGFKDMAEIRVTKLLFLEFQKRTER